MFHAELRMGMHVVRRFNLADAELWRNFIEPLLGGAEFELEGHEFTPRETQLTIYEGPALRPDQLALGRGWQNAERSGVEVTARVLATAREHLSARVPEPAADGERIRAGQLRERLLGRLSAGPTTAPEILTLAAALPGDSSPAACEQLAARAVWELLALGLCELVPGRPQPRDAGPAQNSGR